MINPPSPGPIKDASPPNPHPEVAPHSIASVQGSGTCIPAPSKSTGREHQQSRLLTCMLLSPTSPSARNQYHPMSSLNHTQRFPSIQSGVDRQTTPVQHLHPEGQAVRPQSPPQILARRSRSSNHTTPKPSCRGVGHQATPLQLPVQGPIGQITPTPKSLPRSPDGQITLIPNPRCILP